jgi:SAM-dependent methyltransferase
MKSWESTYKRGIQINNTQFPEQFVVKFFYSPVFRDLHARRNMRLLDIGSGYGRNISLFQSFTKNITCIDPSKEAVAFVEKTHKVLAKTFTPPNIPLREKFDVLVACNSLYYLNRKMVFRDYFQEVVNLLADGGLFICSFIGEKHSILQGSKKCEGNTVLLRNNKPKFENRIDQKIFLPPDSYDFNRYGLKIVSKGEIMDTFDGETRHLKVFLFER